MKCEMNIKKRSNNKCATDSDDSRDGTYFIVIC